MTRFRDLNKLEEISNQEKKKNDEIIINVNNIGTSIANNRQEIKKEMEEEQKIMKEKDKEVQNLTEQQRLLVTIKQDIVDQNSEFDNLKNSVKERRDSIKTSERNIQDNQN